MPQAAQQAGDLAEGAELDEFALAVAVHAIMVKNRVSAHQVAVKAGLQDRTILGLLGHLDRKPYRLQYASTLALMRWIGFVRPAFVREPDAA